MEIESSVSEASTSASPVKKRRREEDQPATLNRVYIYMFSMCTFQYIRSNIRLRLI